MAAIKQLDIRKFRGISDLTLEDLRAVNIVVGANDTGKTSILEALQLCAAPHDLGTWVDVGSARSPTSYHWLRDIGLLFPVVGREALGLGRHDFRIPEVLSESAIEIEGMSSDGPFGFRASVSDVMTEFLSEREGVAELSRALAISVEVAPPPPMSEAEREKLTQAHARPRVEINKAGTVFTFLVPFSGPLNFTRVVRGMPIQSLPAHSFDRFSHPTHWFSRARLEGDADAIVRIAQAVNDRVRGIEVLDTGYQPELFAEFGDGRLLPLGAYGHGMRQAIGLGLMAQRARGGTLLVDEVDAGIHVSAMPRVFRALVQIAAENHVQLVVTTHSLEAVDAMLGAGLSADELAFFRLEATSTGNVVQRINKEVLTSLRHDRGLDVR